LHSRSVVINSRTGMDEVKYANTLHSLQCSLSPTLPQSQRTECEAYLLQEKTNRDFVGILIFILTSDMPAHTWDVRTLSLTLLHDWMINFWNYLSVDEQVSFRQTIVTLVFKAGMSKGFRTKLASVISNIAVRQFPQQWENFIQEMLTTLTTNPADIEELVIQTLDFTVTDCIDSSLSATLPAARKQEVLGGIKAQLTPILTAVYACLSFHVQQYLALRTSGDVASKSVTVGVIQSVVKLIGALVQFTKPADACAADHNFADFCVDLLQFEEFQHDSLSLLHTISQCTLPMDFFLSLLQKLCAMPLDLLKSGDDDETNFNVITFGECCHCLISHNIGLLSDKHNMDMVARPAVQELMVAYMKLLLSIMQLPIHQITVNVIAEWGKVSTSVNMQKETVKRYGFLADFEM
jgi:hypothetical protein